MDIEAGGGSRVLSLVQSSRLVSSRHQANECFNPGRTGGKAREPSCSAASVYGRKRVSRRCSLKRARKCGEAERCAGRGQTGAGFSLASAAVVPGLRIAFGTVRKVRMYRVRW
jgi:hypothetical protein